MYEKEIEEFKTKKRFTVEDLRTLTHILRSENGCPWDREQTHKSITKDFIEETYEVVEAIEAENAEMLREELGDVLFQVAFHVALSEENGDFTFEDTVSDICLKMIERHPHVFGTTVADTSEKVLANWDVIKAETKKQETLYDRLSAVPVTLPAIMRAQKLIHRAEKCGVKVDTALYNFTNKANAEELIAEQLWSLISAADKAGIDAETALRHLSEQFIKSHRNT